MFMIPYYLPRFICSALKGILRKQNLRLPVQPISYQANFLLTEEIVAAWYQLFNVPKHTPLIPFDYYWPHFLLFCLQAIDCLQLNYRNILHLGHEIYFERAKGIQLGEMVQVELQLKDIAWLDRNRAVMIIESQITGAAASKILRCVDTIFIKNLTEENVSYLKNAVYFNHTDLSAFQQLSQHKIALTGTDIKTSQYVLSANFGLQYGKVSGDFNPIHTQPWLAKLFGYSHAFVQGSATVNFLIKLFYEQCQENLTYLKIKFCRPALLNQTIYINYSASEFEIIDSQGKLVAFGEYAKN